MGDVELSDPPDASDRPDLSDRPGAAGAPAKRASSLEYRPDPVVVGRVSVRGFRVLLALMLLNTTLLGASVMGPQLFPFLIERWQQWKAHRAELKAQEQNRQKALAVRQQALKYARPAGSVVYDEDPAESARVIRDGDMNFARATVANNRSPPPGWLPPIMAVTPTLYRDFQLSVMGQIRNNWGNPLLMLHERVAPGGVRHVVAVQLHPSVMFNDTTIYDHAPQKFHVTHRQSKQRTLVVTAWPVGTAAAPAPAGEPPVPFVERTYRLHLPDAAEREVAQRVTNARGESSPVPLDYGNVMRFYAGEPDPADASHFTLPYRLDGREGVIDGWVRDNGVELRAREGDWVFDGGDVLRLRPPATRPTIYPARADNDDEVRPAAAGVKRR